MRFTLMLALLGACDQPPTVGDAVQLIAESTCQRFIRCGWTTETDMDQCVQHAVDELCSTLRCGAEYSRLDNVEACTEQYATLDCSVTQHVCTL